MSREIKFRGMTLRKGEKCRLDGTPIDGKWVYGGIFPPKDDKHLAIIYQKKPEVKKYPVYADTVGQYTGFHDKTDKEIYEGDILSLDDVGEAGYEYREGFDFKNRGVVVFENGRWELDLLEKDNSAIFEEMCGCQEVFIENFENAEVIGNIHENPGLLG